MHRSMIAFTAHFRKFMAWHILSKNSDSLLHIHEPRHESAGLSKFALTGGFMPDKRIPKLGKHAKLYCSNG